MFPVTGLREENVLDDFDQGFYELRPDLYHEPIYPRCIQAIEGIADIMYNYLIAYLPLTNDFYFFYHHYDTLRGVLCLESSEEFH